MRPLLIALLLASSALAQTPQGPQGPFNDPLDKAKRADYFLRYADEARAKKAFDDTRIQLHTPAFKDALHTYEPGVVAPLAVTWDEAVTSLGTAFIALQFGLPPDAPKAKTMITAFGEVVNDNGKVLFDYEEPVEVKESKGDLFAERTLFIPWGKAKGTFGVALNGHVIALGRAHIVCEEATKTSSGLSHLLVSNNVYNLAKMQSMFEPFAFGGTKVVPKPDRAFKRNDDLWLFAEMRNPTVGANGLPNVTMNVSIERDGKRVARVPIPVEPLPLKGVEGHFGVGTTIDMSSFAPGEYKLRVTFTDALATKSYEREEVIKLVE